MTTKNENMCFKVIWKIGEFLKDWKIDNKLTISNILMAYLSFWFCLWKICCNTNLWFEMTSSSSFDQKTIDCYHIATFSKGNAIRQRRKPNSSVEITKYGHYLQLLPMYIHKHVVVYLFQTSLMPTHWIAVIN